MNRLQDLLMQTQMEQEKVNRKKRLAGYKAMFDVDFYPADSRYYEYYNDCINFKITIEEFKEKCRELTLQLGIQHTNNSTETEMLLTVDEFNELIRKEK